MSSGFMAAVRTAAREESDSPIEDYIRDVCARPDANPADLVNEILMAIRHWESSVICWGLEGARWLLILPNFLVGTNPAFHHLRYTEFGEQLRTEALRLLTHRSRYVVHAALDVLDDHGPTLSFCKDDGRWLKSREVRKAIDPLLSHRERWVAHRATELMRWGKKLQQS